MRHKFTICFLLFSSLLSAQFSFMTPVEQKKMISRQQAVTPITASISYQGYDENQPYFGEGEYELFVDTVDGILDRPIIVLDGFDPGDSRDINGLYNSLNFSGQNLADIVRDEGYDIVVLNAPQYTTNGKDIDGGADYIQRNAMVLIELINEINAQKVGNAELVVLGPSMGGLIARYALAYMEQNSLPHETRLYISFDSPHKGANIPISLQYLINYLAEEFGNLEAQQIVETVLNSPAAKEMLYDHLLAHLLAGSNTQQDPNKLTPEGAPDFRNAFQAELDALGFPQNVRNVAMINGSGIGATSGSPGTQVVNTTLNIATGVTADVDLHFTPESGQTINITSFDTFIVGIPAGSFDAEAQSVAIDGVDSAPGGTSQISNALGGAGTNQIIIDFINALDQDDFSFIPTISALALDNEDDWYVNPDIGGVHTSSFVNTFIPDENQSHVEVTQANVQFALDEIRQTVLGLNENNNKLNFMLAQNPVAEDIVLKVPPTASETITVTIYNQLGQKLFRKGYTNTSENISISHQLTSGLYFLKVNASDQFQTLKFLIK